MKRYILFLLAFVLCLSQTFALGSFDAYVDKVESYIVEREDVSRLDVLHALDYYKVYPFLSSEKRALLQTVYDQITIAFTSCGPPSYYSDQKRYSSFKTIMEDADIFISDVSVSPTEYYNKQMISDICYAEQDQFLIFNVPLMNSNRVAVGSVDPYLISLTDPYYKLSLNIYSYDLKERLRERALRDPDHISLRTPERVVAAKKLAPVTLHVRNEEDERYDVLHPEHIVWSLGARKDDTISLESGHGDAGCRSQYYFGYNIVKHMISLEKKCSGCVEEEMGTGDFSGEKEECAEY